MAVLKVGAGAFLPDRDVRTGRCRIAKQQPAAPVAVPPETPQAGNKRNDEGAIKPRQAPQLPLDEEEVAGTLATPSTSKKVPAPNSTAPNMTIITNDDHRAKYYDAELQMTIFTLNYKRSPNGTMSERRRSPTSSKSTMPSLPSIGRAELIRRNDAPAAAATGPAPARPRFVAVPMPVPASDPAAPAAHASDKAVQSDCPKFLQLQEREAEVAVGLQQVHPGSGPGIRGRGSPRMFSRIVKSLSGSRTWKPRLGTFLPIVSGVPSLLPQQHHPQGIRKIVR
ncbi:hypothetical protein FPSE_08264 [Fusarium pseudograminearum CS3096]|uniref:Uncharacterized protein n=1 Tax=Fusarium pseudograminearum (strain CS3096) TaxID=1028729 RepID=K3VZ18_FUSPC|nr:hypothetical protein FPSE_08264 [Fusarium pseudograminearum CS3096]EKJ71625.1 hypothetical protein FPSE_08264 [Fusarium pseudograminearum CS3096]